VAEEVNAEGFDSFGIAPGSDFNGFGAGIVENTDGNGDGVALLFVFLKEEGHVALAGAVFGDFEPGVGVLEFVESGSGGGTLGEIGGIDFGGVEDFAADEGDGGGGQAAGAGLGDVGGESVEVFEGDDVLLFAAPALETGLAPAGKVLAFDGFAFEQTGEDFFYDGKFIEPGEDFGTFLSIKEALIELFAEFAGEAGDFADESGLRVVFMFWLRRVFVRRDIFENTFVIHPAILAREGKGHSS
jgi:hypothetical protein